MGIAERSYYQDRGRGSGGIGGGFGRGVMGSGRLSVIAWLIIINAAVFFVDLFLPTVQLVDINLVDSSLPREVIRRAVPVDVPLQPGQSAPGLGEQIQRPLVDPVNGQQVGIELSREWHLLNGLGHFSLIKGFLKLEVWRVVTYQFLHADLSHLFFNMFGLFMFGGMVEQYLGRKKFLSFYLLCGISGGLLYLIIVGLGALGVPLPGTLRATNIGTPLIGASAGVFGVIVACARLSPDERVMLLFPPIPLKLKWLAYGYVTIAAGNLIMGGQNAGGDAAHIGGAVAGFFFIRRIDLLRGFLDFGLGPAPKQGESRLSRRADELLKKAHERGVHSLTEREKKIINKSAREGQGR